MVQLEPGKALEGRAGREALRENLPDQGREAAADQYARKEELVGKLLERYLTQPDERGTINTMMSAPDAPFGLESRAVLERHQAISLRITYLEVTKPEERVLRQVVDELVSIARKECTPEEREVLSEHTRHMARWLGNDAARDAAERVHKIVREMGKNDLALVGIEAGYRLNDTKDALLEMVHHTREMASTRLDQTIEEASKAIDDAKKNISAGVGELLHGIADGVRSSWSNVVDLSTKIFDETKTHLTSMWNNALGAGRDFLTSLTQRWDEAALTAKGALSARDGDVVASEAREVLNTITEAIEKVEVWVEENRTANLEPEIEKLKDEVRAEASLPRKTIAELASIPDLDDPDFSHKMLFYRLGLEDLQVTPLSSPQPGESVTVMPSDPLSILALKEACHQYISEMQPRLESLTSTAALLEAGEHPLQRKVEDLKDLLSEQGPGAGRRMIEGKIASLQEGLELFKEATNNSKNWLEDQFVAYEDKGRFEALGSLELERQLKVQQSVLADQVEQTRMIREDKLPDIKAEEVKEVLPILNKRLFALYLATYHSADGITGSVTQREVPYEEYKDVFAPSHREGYRMRREVTLAGSESVGTVDFVRQIHTIPGQAEPDVQITSYSQEMILRHLVATGPKVVFREGSAYDVPASSPTRNLQLSVAEVEKAFPQGLLDGDLNERQRHLLTTLGAPVIYGVLNPDVSLMATAYPEMEQYQRSVQMLRPDLSEACVIPLREQDAIAKVQEYLSSHPGEKVALVYGAAHYFNQTSLDVKEDSLSEMPLIVASDWPALQFDMLNEFLGSKAIALQGAENKEVKALLALNANEVSISTFLSVKDPELQLALLPRIIPDYSYQTQPSDLEKLLLSALPRDQQYDVVRSEIKARAAGEAPRAPFNLLVSKEYDWEAVAEADSFLIDQTVMDQEDYPSRYALVRGASSIGYASYALTASAELQREILPKVVVTGTEEEIFNCLVGATRSPEVVEDLERHRKEATGPFFSTRFSNSSVLCDVALSQARKSEYWKQLDWDARAEVVQTVGSLTPGESEAFLNDCIMRALGNDATAHRQIFCALETGLRTGIHFQELLIEASPYLGLSQDSSVSSGFVSLLERAADKQQWKAYQSLALLLSHEGEAGAWFSIIGTVPHIRDVERSLVLSLLVDELKKPESAVRERLSPLFSAKLGSEYDGEMAFVREAFKQASLEDGTGAP